jgi:hypothetical protein
MIKDLFSVFESKSDSKSKDSKLIKKVHRLEENNENGSGNPAKKVHTENDGGSNPNA